MRMWHLPLAGILFFLAACSASQEAVDSYAYDDSSYFFIRGMRIEALYTEGDEWYSVEENEMSMWNYFNDYRVRLYFGAERPACCGVRLAALSDDGKVLFEEFQSEKKIDAEGMLLFTIPLDTVKCIPFTVVAEISGTQAVKHTMRVFSHCGE